MNRSCKMFYFSVDHTANSCNNSLQIYAANLKESKPRFCNTPGEAHSAWIHHPFSRQTAGASVPDSLLRGPWYEGWR